MLSIKEKVVFGVLLALFIVPEIMWLPIRSQLYNIYAGYTLHTGKYIDLWSAGSFYETILFLQFASIFLFFLMTLWKRKKISNKKVFWGMLLCSSLFVLCSFAAWLLVYAMLHVAITNGLP